MLMPEEKSMPPAYTAPDYSSTPSVPNSDPPQPMYSQPEFQQPATYTPQPAQPPQQAYAMQPQFMDNQPQTIPQHPQQTYAMQPQFMGTQQQNLPQPGSPQQTFELQPQMTGIQQSAPHVAMRQASMGGGYPQQPVHQGSIPAPQQEFARSAPQQGVEQQQQQPAQGFGAPQQFYTAVPLSVLGQGSAPADCPACRKRAMTITNTEVGNTTHAWAAGFCFLFCLGCIPYLMTSTMNVRHNCGHCGALLATWHRSGRTVVHAHS